MTITTKKPFQPRPAPKRLPGQNARQFATLACALFALLIVTFTFDALAAQQQNQLAEQHNQAWPALMRAAWAGDISSVRAELEAGADVNARSHTGSTALLAATMKSHAQIVEILLEYDATVDGRNNPGNTALMVAVRNGDVALTRLLLRYGADVYTTNRQAESPFSIARSLGNKEILALLQQIKS